MIDMINRIDKNSQELSREVKNSQELSGGVDDW